MFIMKENLINNNLESKIENTFQSTPSAFFEINGDDKTLRKLMSFIQEEGIIMQNNISFKESCGRKMLIWVNADDSEKIKIWLNKQLFDNK